MTKGMFTPSSFTQILTWKPHGIFIPLLSMVIHFVGHTVNYGMDFSTVYLKTEKEVTDSVLGSWDACYSHWNQ